MSELSVTLSATYDEMDFLFNEGSYDHPQIPLFDLGIKSYEEIRDKNDNTIHVDRNIKRKFKVTVRTYMLTGRTHFPSPLAFIKKHRMALSGKTYLINKAVQERMGYSYDKFINGADLSDKDIVDLMKSYKADLKGKKYETRQLVFPIREAYNNGIDKSFETDLDADGRQAFTEGYYQCALDMLGKISGFVKLLNRKAELDRKTELLKTNLPDSLQELTVHLTATTELNREIEEFKNKYKIPTP